MIECTYEQMLDAICREFMKVMISRTEEMNTLRDALKVAREERDEARRELCIGLADHTDSKFTLPEGCWNQLNVEHDRGWDCFKEPPE